MRTVFSAHSTLGQVAPLARGSEAQQGRYLPDSCRGEVAGVRLLSPQTIDRIFEVQSQGIDLVIGIPSKWGLGYGLFPEGRGCAFGGYGGSLVVIDADRRMTFAYVMNKMAPGGGTIAAALAERVSDIVKR